MANIVSRLLKNRRGATSIEYALIATFIALAIIGSVTLVGTDLEAVFNDVAAGF